MKLCLSTLLAIGLSPLFASAQPRSAVLYKDKAQLLIDSILINDKGSAPVVDSMLTSSLKKLGEIALRGALDVQDSIRSYRRRVLNGMPLDISLWQYIEARFDGIKPPKDYQRGLDSIRAKTDSLQVQLKRDSAAVDRIVRDLRAVIERRPRWYFAIGYELTQKAAIGGLTLLIPLPQRLNMSAFLGGEIRRDAFAVFVGGQYSESGWLARVGLSAGILTPLDSGGSTYGEYGVYGWLPLNQFDAGLCFFGVPIAPSTKKRYGFKFLLGF